MEERRLKLVSSEVKYVFKAGIGLICLEGEIDFAVYPELNKFLKSIFDYRNCPLIIDLSRVTFIDNTGGLRAIREAAGRLGLERVAIVNANENIKRMLAKANMSEFAQYSNITKASAALSVDYLKDDPSSRYGKTYRYHP